MATIAKLLVQLDMNSAGFTKGIGQTQKAASGIKKALTGAFAVAGGLGIAKVTSAFAGAVSGAIDFNRQMANVNSIAQVSQGQLDGIAQKVLALAGPTGQAPEVLAAGLYDIYSSGFQGAAAIDVLTDSAKAATAGVTGTDVAARAITASLNAYSLGADQAGMVSDVLFQTVNDGVISFEQLANNLGNTLPIASSLGISIQELGAAYAQMTLKGVNGAQAETQIAGLMRAALNPTDALTAAVQAQGFSSASAAIEQEGLAGFIDIVTKAAGGNKEALFKLLGTQEAMNAATILGADDTKGYRDEIDKMNHASDGAGATQKALAKQMESAAFKIQQAKVAIKTLVTVGFGILAPVVAKVAVGLTSLITKGVLPFVDIIKEATKGQFGFTKAVAALPQPLQRTAHAVGVVIEGITDLAAFALKGDWHRFITRLPGEIDQITTGLAAMGSELLQGATFVANIAIDLVTSFVGWLWDNRGDIWGGIKTFVGWSVGNIVEGISWTLSIGIPKLIGWAISSVGNLLLNMIYGPTGDLTGGPQPHGSPTVVLKAWLLDVAVPTLAGWATGAVSWINTKLQQVVDGVKLIAPKILGWLLDIGIPTAEGWIDQAVDWFDQKVHSKLDGTRVKLLDWNLEIGAPSVGFGIGFSGGEDIGKKIREKLGHIDLYDFTTWAILLTVPEQVFLAPITLGILIPNLIIEKLTGLSVVGLTAWVLTVGIPAVIGGALGLIFGLAPEVFTFLSGLAITVTDFTAWILDIGIPTTITLLVFLADKFFQKLKDAAIFVKNFVDWALSLGLPDLSLGFTADTLAGAIAAEVATMDIGDIPFPIHLNLIPDFGTGDTNDTLGGQGGFGGIGAGGRHGKSALVGNMFGGDRFTIPAPDTSGALKAVTGVQDALQRLSQSTYTPTLDANAKPALVKLVSATLAGSAFASMTFVPTFDASPSPFLGKLTDAVRAVVAFAGTTFTTTLAGNGNPAFNTLVGLYIEGYGWANSVFTATFSINTSPLLAALDTVRFVAGEVAALLPHSPAEKGPLRKPISFGYIADNLDAAMNRLGPSARRGLAGVNGALNGVNVSAAGMGNGADGGRSGFTNYGTINVRADNPEQFLDQMRAYGLNGSRGGR